MVGCAKSEKLTPDNQAARLVISFGTGREKKPHPAAGSEPASPVPGAMVAPLKHASPAPTPDAPGLDLCPDPGAITERADRAAVGTPVRHPLRRRAPPARGPSRTSLPQRCSSRGQFSNIVVAAWFAGEHRCHNDVGGGGRGRTSLPQRCWRRRARRSCGRRPPAPSRAAGPRTVAVRCPHFSLSENSAAPPPPPPRPGTTFGFDATPYRPSIHHDHGIGPAQIQWNRLRKRSASAWSPRTVPARIRPNAVSTMLPASNSMTAGRSSTLPGS